MINTPIMIYSMMAGMATVLGSLLVLAWRSTERFLAFLLGLAAGIMAAVVLQDLVPAALKFGSLKTTLAGILLGVLILGGLDRLLSGPAPSTRVRSDRLYLLKMGYLIAAGIALHDLPEGMAMAVGWAATKSLGWMLALSIGLHNIPEGMATSVPLKMAGVPGIRILALNFLVSIFTPLGTLLGLVLVSMSRFWIGLLLALAAGAMSYIVGFGLVPEAFGRRPRAAALGLLLGWAVIGFLTLFE
ncbi:MAG: ZIP family metal transporter [Bacillota bacterium]